jgi:ketosteroid isomerase-like protein
MMETSRQAAVREIEGILRRIEVAENTGNPSEIADMLAEDAVIMVPNQPVQEGKAACAAFFADVMAGLLVAAGVANRSVSLPYSRLRIGSGGLT